MKNDGRVYFGLWGDFTPSEATERIGIEPTESWLKHSRFPERKVPKESIWDYSSETIKDDIVDVYLLSRKVVDDLLPHTEKIRDYISEKNLRARLEVVLYISSDDSVSTPIIGFDETVLKFLADVGATIDIDTYRKYE